MRVRVWIGGSEGPSHDFELLNAPRIGDRISISCAGRLEEGIVATVVWNLQAIDGGGSELSIEGEPAGSVTLVHVICSPSAEVLKVDFEHAEIGEAKAAGGAVKLSRPVTAA